MSTATQPTPMTRERAGEINAAICAFAFYDMGICTAEDVAKKAKALKDVSLAQMLEATAIVAACKGLKQEDGTTRLSTVADDRLTAAVYTALHYDPSNDESIVCIPPRKMFYGKAALMLVDLDKMRGGDDDDGD